MEDSITYQEIRGKGKIEGIAEGRPEEARELVVMLGTKRFGPPNAVARRKLQTIEDLRRLHQLVMNIDNVKTWKDLLAAKSVSKTGRCVG